MNAKFAGQPLDESVCPPCTPLERAQDLCYQAFDCHGRRAVQLARQALAVWPDCADAYVILAEYAASPEAELEYYRLGVAAGEHWEPARGEFLVPVGVLSRKIAAKFRDAVKKEKPDLLASIPAGVCQREWVSFLKHYGHGNDAVLDYLSRYVFRTAISNARILGMDDTHVTFRYKDRATDTWRTMRLPGVEFLRQFLQHVPSARTTLLTEWPRFSVP